MPPPPAERMRKLGKAGFKVTFGTAAFALLAAIILANVGFPDTWPVIVCFLTSGICFFVSYFFAMIWHEGYRLTQK